MKRGDVVTIYENPMTMEKIEGEARLVRLLSFLGDNLERWAVHFPGDSPGSYVERVILADGKALAHEQIRA